MTRAPTRAPGARPGTRAKSPIRAGDPRPAHVQQLPLTVSPAHARRSSWPSEVNRSRPAGYRSFRALLGEFGETRRILVQAGDEAAGPLGCRWLKGLAVAMLGCRGAEVCWHGCALRGRRLECRDHGLAGDYGGSRGRARARSAVIKDQFMIMEPHAGDRPAAPARRGNPAVACTAATVPRVAAAKAGRASAGDAAGSPGSGRAAGGRRCRGYIVGGPLWWQPGRVGYVDDGLLLLSWQLYRGIVEVPGRAGHSRNGPTLL